MRIDIPLATLPAFEAAGRHESFALAATEFNLSQAAISRQMKALEDRLGVQLFERRHRSVRLTAAGSEFHRTVGVALRLVSDSIDKARPKDLRSSINIATDLAFAHFWLIPRLGLLNQRHDKLVVSVTASDQESDCLKPSADVPIVYGSGDWPGYDARMLFDEEIFPVCSPAYLKSLDAFAKPADLLDATLLHVADGSPNWVNWREWLSFHDVQGDPVGSGISLNSLPWTIQAACNGQGIALGWKYLCDDLLINGTLVRPIPHSMKTNRAYYMLFRQDAEQHSLAHQIFEWVINLRDDKRHSFSSKD